MNKKEMNKYIDDRNTDYHSPHLRQDWEDSCPSITWEEYIDQLYPKTNEYLALLFPNN